MVRDDNADQPDPSGGGAAERRRQFLRERFGDALDREPDAGVEGVGVEDENVPGIVEREPREGSEGDFDDGIDPAGDAGDNSGDAGGVR
jgi:hypothetical protein